MNFLVVFDCPRLSQTWSVIIAVRVDIKYTEGLSPSASAGHRVGCHRSPEIALPMLKGHNQACRTYLLHKYNDMNSMTENVHAQDSYSISFMQSYENNNALNFLFFIACKKSCLERNGQIWAWLNVDWFLR